MYKLNLKLSSKQHFKLKFKQKLYFLVFLSCTYWWDNTLAIFLTWTVVWNFSFYWDLKLKRLKTTGLRWSHLFWMRGGILILLARHFWLSGSPAWICPATWPGCPERRSWRPISPSCWAGDRDWIERWNRPLVTQTDHPMETTVRFEIEKYFQKIHNIESIRFKTIFIYLN